MRKYFKVFITTLSFTLFYNFTYANAGFYENTGATQNIEAVFDFGSGLDYDRLVDLNGTSYGSFVATDQWDLKGGIAHVFRDNGSNITAVNLNYRVYEVGTTAPTFSSVSLSWQQDYIGTNNQRWGETGQTIDLLAGLSTTGNYQMDFYYSATTNSVNVAPEVYWSNTSANYILTFSYTAPLPVDLIDFSAYLDNDLPAVKWSTASEYNCSHFELFTSTDGNDKNYVGSVEGNGNSNQLHDYSFLLTSLKQSDSYIFLKQLDYDGQAEWFGPIELKSIVNSDATAFFNKNGNLQINRSNSKNVHARLVTLTGVEIASKSLQFTNETLYLGSLREGMYLLVLGEGEDTNSIKVIR